MNESLKCVNVKKTVCTTKINDTATHVVVDLCAPVVPKTRLFHKPTNNMWANRNESFHVVICVLHQVSPRPCWNPPGRYPPYLLDGRTPPPNASTTVTPVRRARPATGLHCLETANPTSVTATSTPWPSSGGRCSSSRWAETQHKHGEYTAEDTGQMFGAVLLLQPSQGAKLCLALISFTLNCVSFNSYV